MNRDKINEILLGIGTSLGSAVVAETSPLTPALNIVHSLAPPMTRTRPINA